MATLEAFWVDCNVFVQAKNLYYAFDLAPGFWQKIMECSKSGQICCPMMVYTEIAKGGDDLTDWANTAKSLGFFSEPDKSVQQQFSRVATHVTTNGKYHSAQGSLFMKGADPWVVAAAMANGGTVVTQEKLVGPDSTKVKIPNVCKEFGVPYINSYEMLRRVKMELHQKDNG